jgi:hypothetical protein
MAGETLHLRDVGSGADQMSDRRLSQVVEAKSAAQASTPKTEPSMPTPNGVPTGWGAPPRDLEHMGLLLWGPKPDENHGCRMP